MSLQTLNDIFFAITGRDQPQLMLRKSARGWEPISSQEFAAKVAGVATALRSFGISRGDRVAILSENRHEWVVADFACLLLGAIVVPIYTTLTPEQTAYMLRDSGARAIFVSSLKHLETVGAILDTTAVEKIVIMDDVADARASCMADLMQFPGGPQFDSLAHSIQPDDLATIIYTSGTTGVPKGVMLTHGNMAANINCFLASAGFEPGFSCVSFLPLSHVTARCVDLGLLYSGVTLAHLSQLDQLSQALLEVRPQILLSVPRVYEKVHAQVAMHAAKFPAKQIYHWALWVGRAHRAEILAGITPRSLRWKLADSLIYSKIRAGMGGRVKTYLSGGAPLGLPLAEWFADVGIRICEGYGLTETSPVIAANNPSAHRIGSVGKPLANLQVRIAEDGEILVRGPSVFQCYWNKPDETREAFVDGWFKTGDIGRLDEDGFLYVTDRKKDLLKTSGGKFIAPQPIEGALKHNPMIAEAVVIGDKRNFPAVLIVPNFAALEPWAQERGVTFSSREKLIADARVRAFYEEIVAELNTNLAQFEKLKKVALLAEEFSAANGTMTASLKIRRRAVEERCRGQIEKMYGDGDRIS
jgi:long-chain acyl-CoA synthetase